MSATFEWWVEDLDGMHVVHLHGELDMADADRLKDALVTVGRSTVRVDLNELTFLDATGLDAIVSAGRAVRSDGSAFHIVGATGIVRRVFELTGMGPLLND